MAVLYKACPGYTKSIWNYLIINFLNYFEIISELVNLYGYKSSNDVLLSLYFLFDIFFIAKMKPTLNEQVESSALNLFCGKVT